MSHQVSVTMQCVLLPLGFSVRQKRDEHSCLLKGNVSVSSGIHFNDESGRNVQIDTCEIYYQIEKINILNTELWIRSISLITNSVCQSTWSNDLFLPSTFYLLSKHAA